MSNIKSPPIFNPDKDDDYCAWKNDVEVWQAFAKEKPRQQGPAVYLSLKGRAREAVRGISINDLKKYDGVEEIIRILEEIFQSGETTRAYHPFKDYVEYRRSRDQNFSSFAVAYEKIYREMKRYKLDLPTGVQAFFLLQAANVTRDLEKMVRTTATLVCGDIKEKIRWVSDSCGKGSGGVPIKAEDCYYTNQKGY